MASSNVLGDSLVIFGLYNFIVSYVSAKLNNEGIVNHDNYSLLLEQNSTILSLKLVAVVTISFTLLGIYIGFKYLSKSLDLKFYKIFTESINFYKGLYNNFLNR
jgi:ABC-type uncharacterized transport system fused permease/ATPase subunit